jgi:hypothetical protein
LSWPVAPSRLIFNLWRLAARPAIGCQWMTARLTRREGLTIRRVVVGVTRRPKLSRSKSRVNWYVALLSGRLVIQTVVLHLRRAYGVDVRGAGREVVPVRRIGRAPLGCRTHERDRASRRSAAFVRNIRLLRLCRTCGIWTGVACSILFDLRHGYTAAMSRSTFGSSTPGCPRPASRL